MGRLTVLCLVLVLHRLAFSQTFENIRASTVGDKVIIQYDLSSPKPGVKVNVKVYSSHNNFTVSLTQITGDVTNVLPGKARRIEWDATKELQQYAGKISFELKGELVFDWMLIRPLANSSFAKGKRTTIQWQGGNAQSVVTLELLSPNGERTKLNSGENTGSYTWSIPKNLAKGKGYKLNLTSGSTSITSEPFTIRKKFPVLYVVGPIVVGTALVLFVKPGDEPLPKPPGQGN